jgi:adenine-specific DNA-methyltransferase
MAKKSGTGKRPVEQYEHKDRRRKNNPPVGLVDANPDAVEGKKKIESSGAEQIAFWMLDTDYGRSLFARQVFLPMAGEKEGWAKLAKNLKGEIDEETIEAYRGTVLLPFESGKHRRIGVKIVDNRGMESLKIIELP